ncbi:corepressor interacting with rbpj 1 [Plakobranchus ocellatus]|uniref:Corepressor interacting with rbpj 1 n=1 Tax=Plakobranchus ocellatus TaxID=259542 RepID=A0AAV4DMF8_9GAST|nr:corepressor interacting with rbpj 1 [Plakobranchus ocellatus]
MGKGFNNYMTKKFFHPASKDNIKRKWMAEQKTAFEKKQQEDLLAQYQKEQEVLSNRALLGDEKAKLGLSFLYDAPPGLKKKEEPEGQQEVKFEWQRKYNAPREAYAKDDDTIRDQPFGIEVRNVRCIKCRQWGHVNTDKICPLYGKNLTAEPELPSSSNASLLSNLKSEGFTLKNSVLSKMMESDPDNRHSILAQEDEDDPEVKFLKSLTPKQKKKLLKKLNKLQSKSEKGIVKKSKHKKKKSKSKKVSDGESSGDEMPKFKSVKSPKHRRPPSSSDSDSEISPQRAKSVNGHTHKGDKKHKGVRENKSPSPLHPRRRDHRDEMSHRSSTHKRDERSRSREKHRARRHLQNGSASPDNHRNRYRNKERSQSPTSYNGRRERSDSDDKAVNNQDRSDRRHTRESRSSSRDRVTSRKHDRR